MTQRPDTILVPVDGSALAEAAVDHAVMLCAHLGSRLIVFMAIGRPERDALEAFATSEEIALDEAADAALGRLVGRVPTEVECEARHVIADNPAEAILDAADDEGVSMIVMASHGRSGVSRWLLGSVTHKVAQSASVPVLIVPVRERS